ncbi:hypothetical protein J6590_100935 [Homalodisca vitripennis]|nr:hypothetical protein J6590_100935 [Homalodisca vitripennis]
MSRSLEFGSELEIKQVQILSATIAHFISTIDLVLYRLSLLFCLIRSSHRPVAHKDGQKLRLKRGSKRISGCHVLTVGLGFSHSAGFAARFLCGVVNCFLGFISPNTGE